MDVNSELLDAAIRHDVQLRRFSTASLNRLIKLLNQSDARIFREIQRRGVGDGSFTNRRLNLLLDAIREINVAAYVELRREFRGEVRGLATYEGEFQTRLLNNAVLPLGLNIVSPAPAQLLAAVNSRPFQGRLLRDFYRDLEPSSFRRIKQNITLGFIEGRTTDQIVRDIRGTRANGFKDGVQGVTRRSVATTVRTALNHTATAARGKVYQDNSDIIKGEMWVSTLDSRTCFVAGTMVLTPNGLMPIETIQRGDVVIGGSREQRTVLGAKMSTGTKMARVTLSNGEIVTCTEDHLFLTDDNIWVEARDIEPRQRLSKML